MRVMRVRRVQLGGAGAPMTGTLAVPDGYPPGPAIVVVQEWWGLNGQIEMVTQRFAGLGFAAVAPDLFRGKLTTEPDEAEKLMMELDGERAVEDLKTTVSFLKNQGATGIGVMGFCMGGWLTWELAYSDDRLSAAVPCYGFAEAEGRELRCPVQMHVGTEDDFEPVQLETIAASLRARGDGSELFLYEGADHAFMNDQRPEVHRPEDTDLAFERAVAFFTEKLGAPVPV
jgi:carboxymethylenebutenolidase